jgi:Lamin Tail Domain
MKKIFSILFLLASFVSFSQSTTVVISQVYPGGGSSSPTVTYRNDYVELHNISGVTQDISGFSLQYGSSTGNFGNSATQIYTFPAATTIPAGAYLLIQLGTAGTGGAVLPVTPDFSSTNLSMGAASGKVALVSNGTATGCGATATPCTLPSATLIDVVSYGASNNAEGGVTVNNGVALPANTNGCVRKNNGCTETDNNNADFDVVVNPVPRNSASPIFSCTATPSISATALTAFGSVCINTTTAPNSFTISGSNLTTANVTVAALPGFTYATTSGGPYAASLSLTQTGGTYSQQIFVQFNPTAVQSYNGNIAVGGGGVSASINVAAAGSGVNSMATVTTGGASAITQISATTAGSIPSIGCSAVTAYGIEYSTTSGFPNGTGTPAPSTNLSGGNFSSNLAGLTAATTYYYKAWATNAGGTAYGLEQSFTTLSPNPSIVTSSLTAFGNVCINTTAGPNSFTITGGNLTTANVTVGPLTGYTFSTTSGGTYTASLSLTQPGGSYSQQVFVRFTPTAVQSYNGNIPVDGGGIAAAVNVAASGAGVNTTATVTTGAASAITQTTATTAGSIPANGCSNVTAYGIEYSTTNNFPTGTGTQVASTNIAGGNFTAALTGLTPSTTYYYRAYATNAGGTAYGSQMSFTTASPTLTATALTAFGNVCINTTTAANSFTLTGVGLTNANVNVGPFTGYTFSTTSGGTYTASLSLVQPGGAYSQAIFVKFSPTAVQTYNGNIPVNGGGATATTVAVAGSGVNTLATVTTGSVSNLTNHSATLAGSISDNGCSNVTAYGIEYSGINGFLNGNGTKAASTNISGGNFTASLTGLVQGATYYYKAYAVNNGGTAYGVQQSFTVPSIAAGFLLYPNPVEKGTAMRITVDSLKAGYYGLLLFDAAGRKVYQHNMNIQVDFINQLFTIPGTLQPGIYRAYLVNFEETIGIRTILVQ